MIIALTGLHASGKSYFAKTIAEKYGFEVIYKNDLIAKICKSMNINDWYKWYYENFNKDKYATTLKILSHLPKDKNIVLDAVHSYDEWMIIKNYYLNAFLIVIVTPEKERIKRQEECDSIKNQKRINYWHNINNNEINCLLAEAFWTFNGASSLEINEQSFLEFLEFININNNLERKKVKWK